MKHTELNGLYKTPVNGEKEREKPFLFLYFKLFHE